MQILYHNTEDNFFCMTLYAAHNCYERVGDGKGGRLAFTRQLNGFKLDGIVRSYRVLVSVADGR